jgi:hypothetical protein
VDLVLPLNLFILAPHALAALLPFFNLNNFLLCLRPLMMMKPNLCHLY